MNKRATTQVPIHDLVAERWSPLSFADRAVEPEKLLALLEAARWAPSSFNEQPWVYFVATKAEPDEYDKLFQCLMSGNQPWAQAAPILMLSVAHLKFNRNEKPNRHAYHDVGLASATLSLQATALGLVVHQMAGFDQERTRAALAIPADWDPVAMMALGYPGEPSALPEALQEREVAPRTRKELADFIFTGQWGQSAKKI